MTETAEIYALLRSDGSIAYIGCAHDAKDRLKRHWRERTYVTRQHRASATWLRTLDAPPEMTILEVVSWSERGDAESRWIKHYRQAGEDLLNATDGGVGFTGDNYVRPPEVEEKRIAALREARERETGEQKLARSVAISRGREGVVLSPEMAKRVGRKKGVPMSAEERAKRGLKDKPVPDNAAWCEVCSAGPFKGPRGLVRHKEQKHGIYQTGGSYKG